MRTCIGREDYARYVHEQIPNLIELKDEVSDPMQNFMNALEVAGDDEAIHLEDDAILVDGFIEKAQAVIDTNPTWERLDEHPTGLDLTIADYLKKTKQKYLVYCPNLADHRIGKSEIDSRRSSKRVSLTFKQSGV